LTISDANTAELYTPTCRQVGSNKNTQTSLVGKQAKIKIYKCLMYTAYQAYQD